MATKAAQVESALAGYLDKSGNPLQSGKLYTYEAGTSNPATTWQDVDKVTPHANPVILDAQGQRLIFGDGLYKFEIRDANDNLIETRDNLQYFYIQEALNEVETISAIDADGITIQDDGGNTGITLKDGGNIGIKEDTDPQTAFGVAGSDTSAYASSINVTPVGSDVARIRNVSASGNWVGIMMEAGTSPGIARLITEKVSANETNFHIQLKDSSAASTTDEQLTLTSEGDLTLGNSVNVGNVKISGNTIESISGDLNLNPVSGSDVVIDSYWEFDGNILTGLLDSDMTLTAPAGRSVNVELVEFDNQAVSNVSNLTMSGTLDLGTNTIADGQVNGNWDFNSGNFTEVGQISMGAGGMVIGEGTVSGDVNFDSNTLVVDSSNNRIGIGTASPTYRVDIRSTGVGNVARVLASTGSGAIFLSEATGNEVALALLETGGSQEILFSTGANSYINAGFNFGIGTSNPDSTLQVNGRVAVLENDDDVTTNIGQGLYTDNHIVARGGFLGYRGSNTDGTLIGGYGFANINNSSDSTGSGAKVVAWIGGEIETSDSNAGQDSGGHIVFYTKPEGSGAAEVARFTSDGDLTLNNDLNMSGTINIGTVDFGTNTISDGVMTGSWNFDSDTFYVDSSNNKVYVGASTSPVSSGLAGVGQFQIENDAFAAQQIVTGNNSSGNFSILGLMKARGSTGSPTIVSDADKLGGIFALGYDGANYQQAASIQFLVDGTPGVSDMPGEIQFLTSLDGSASPTQRMYIYNDGDIQMGSSGFYYDNSTGYVGVGGITTPDAPIHAYKGSAGSVSADSSAAIVAEDNNNCYINILTPSTNIGGILFGDENDADAGRILYNHSSSLMEFYVNTAARAHINSSGDFYVNTDTFYVDASTDEVGIGTSSPGSILHVSSDSSIDCTLILNTASNSDSPNISLRTGGTERANIGVASSSSDVVFWSDSAGGRNAGFAFYNEAFSASVPILKIDNSTGVGINVDSPSAELHVKSDSGDVNLRLESDDTNAYVEMKMIGRKSSADKTSVLGYNHTNDTVVLAYDTGPVSAQGINIDSSGNVGVGVIVPDTTMHIASNSDTETPILTIEDEDTTAGSRNARIDFVGNGSSMGAIHVNDVGGMSFWDASGSTVVNIDVNGNLGIGTTSQDAELHGYVDSGDWITHFESSSGSNGNCSIYIDRGVNTRTSGIQFQLTNSLEWQIGVIRNGGSVTNEFSIVRGTDINVTTPAIHIDGADQVGINNSNPGTTLDVTGSIRASSSISTTGGNISITGSGGFTVDTTASVALSIEGSPTTAINVIDGNCSFQNDTTCSGQLFVGNSGRAQGTGNEPLAIYASVLQSASSGDFDCISVDPSAANAYTITRFNIMVIENISLSGSAAVTDGCVIRYDAAAGTHFCVDAGTTKTTPGTVNAWEKRNVNGTVYYIPMYTSKIS